MKSIMDNCWKMAWSYGIMYTKIKMWIIPLFVLARRFVAGWRNLYNFTILQNDFTILQFYKTIFQFYNSTKRLFNSTILQNDFSFLQFYKTVLQFYICSTVFQILQILQNFLGNIGRFVKMSNLHNLNDQNLDLSVPFLWNAFVQLQPTSNIYAHGIFNLIDLLYRNLANFVVLQILLNTHFPQISNTSSFRQSVL